LNNPRPNQIDTAARLKQLLLDLSKEEDYKDFRSIIRAAADSVREKAFGYNRSVTKRKILKLLAEFFALELDDITFETGIGEKEIKAALDDLIKENKIVEGRRRRWQEAGKHYNPIYELPKGR
jgi:acetate kinase